MSGNKLLLAVSHGLVLVAGFGLGVYALPILTAPAAPSADEVAAQSKAATYRGTFKRDLKDSDPFHWGEGDLSVGPRSIALTGRIAPGPDYRLYLSPEWVETEADFARLKPRMVQVGAVKTFNNFIVPIADNVELNRYNTAIVWCESFGEFITAAKYR